VRIWGVVGLALAFALAYTVAAVVAVAVLQRHSPGFDWQALATTWLRLLAAAVFMGALVYGMVTLMSPGSALMLVPVLAGAIALGAVSYFAAILVLRVPGIAELFARLPGMRRFAPRV